MKNSLLNSWMNEVDDMVRSFSPIVEIYESEKEFCFQFDLPGMKEKELKLSVSRQELIISGERLRDQSLAENENVEQTQARKKIHRTERLYGKFERSFYLMEEVDAEKIEAEFSEGVLEVRVPKSETTAAHQIPIHSSEQTH